MALLIQMNKKFILVLIVMEIFKFALKYQPRGCGINRQFVGCLSLLLCLISEVEIFKLERYQYTDRFKNVFFMLII